LAGDVEWTHIWKGFGAVAAAYVFAALASRGLARHTISMKNDWKQIFAWEK
jgi:hypothetical protein